MKYYELETVFTFGKHHGKTLEEVYKVNPSYVDWCLCNLDHFTFNEDVYDCLQGINQNFQFSLSAMEKLQSNWFDEDDLYDCYDEHDYDDPYSDWERDSFDAMTDGQYGSYDDFLENGGDWDRMMDGMGY